MGWGGWGVIGNRTGASLLLAEAGNRHAKRAALVCVVRQGSRTTCNSTDLGDL